MTLLNAADKIYLGATTVSRVYLGANLIWEQGGGPWTPDEITDGMFGWWDASDTASLTFSGANLVEIADKSPANRKLARAFSSGPVLASINGTSALSFIPGQGLRTVDAVIFNDFTICVVFKPNNTVGTYERIADHVWSAGFWFGRTGGTETWGGGVKEGPEINYGIFVPLVNNEVHQISNMREISAHTIRGNGGAVATQNSVTSSSTSPSPVYIADDGNGTSPSTLLMAELIIWSKALSAEDLAKVDGYLAWKWGIEAKLPVGHLYKNAAPGISIPVFSPADISGLNVWLDASQLGLADGAIVSSWPNLAAGGSAPIIETGTLPINFKTNQINGLPVVRFSGGNAGHLHGVTNATFDFTVIYITRRWGPTVGRAFSTKYPPTNVLVGFHSSGQDVAYNGGGWMNAPTAWGGTLPAAWKLYGMDGTASPAAMRFLINGVDAGTVGGGQGLGGGYVLSGYRGDSQMDETMDCDIAELLIYNRQLADVDRVSVENYLRTKWGLP